MPSPRGFYVTRKLVRSLVWVKKNQPVSRFNKKRGPSLKYTKRLEGLGLVEKLRELVPHPDLGNACIAQYALTKKGVKVIKQSRRD